MCGSRTRRLLALRPIGGLCALFWTLAPSACSSGDEARGARPADSGIVDARRDAAGDTAGCTAFGDPCTAHEQCCGFTGTTERGSGFCVELTDGSELCAVTCRAPADCSTSCCAPVPGVDYGACWAASFCSAREGA